MRKTNPQTRGPVYADRAQTEFTIGDHLRVQRQIEQRAFQRWQGRCHRSPDALNDWLAAERETLAEFVKTRMAGARPPPDGHRDAPSLPETVIQRQRLPHRRLSCQTKYR